MYACGMAYVLEPQQEKVIFSQDGVGLHMPDSALYANLECLKMMSVPSMHRILSTIP